jgi:hypothetical protein
VSKHDLRLTEYVRSHVQNADTAASYPELLSQLERLQKDYDDVISRLRKLMDWTKLQARRTWQNDSAAVHCNGCDKQVIVAIDARSTQTACTLCQLTWFDPVCL